MTRRFSVLTALLLTLLGVAGPAAQAHAAARTPVVVVGVPGLVWDDVTASTTPTLWRLAHAGAVGSLSIRSAADLTCPRDGWLTVGAGNRVRAQGDCSTPTDIVKQSTGGRIGTYNELVLVNKGLDFGAVPGILASTLGSGSCVAALGGDSVLGAADRAGRLPYISGTLDRQTLSHCTVTLVDAGHVATPRDAAGADQVVGDVDAARPAGSVLLVVGLSDLPGDTRAHLHVAIATGGPYGPGVLRSQSTRRAPYVQLIDVAPTVLQLEGVAIPSAVDGQPWQRTGHKPASVNELADQDRVAGAVRGALPWVVAAMVAVLALATGLALVRRRRLAALVALVGLAATGTSYLANVVPWWRAPGNVVVLLALTFGLATVVAVPAFRLGDRRSYVIAAGTVAGVVFAILLLDVVSGSHLQMDSVLGYSPLVAGRFAGFGNVAYGVFGSAAMLLAAAAAAKRPGWRAVVVVGVLAVVGDGAPMWGSDVGGVLALVPAFAVMTLWCRGVRLSWQRLLVVGTAAVGVVVVFGLADYARPAKDQTHLGRFVGRVLHGGAGTVLDRKLHSDLDLLTANPGTLLVPLFMVAALWLLLRPRPRLAGVYAQHPQLRYGLLSLCVLAVIGLLVNDSGIAIPAVAILLGLPFVVVVQARDTPGGALPEAEHVLP